MLVAGWLLHLLGLLLILRFALPIGVRALLSVGWVVLGVCELLRFARAQSDLRLLRLYADGSAEALARGAAWEPLAWLADGLIFESIAWLRFRRSDGRLYCELFLRRGVDNKAWRRLQVLGRYARPSGIRP